MSSPEPQRRPSATASFDPGPHPLDLRQDKPHSARLYDYFLGGKDNYEVDRIAAEEVRKIWPTIDVAARKNRGFMHTAARYLAYEKGVRQFLDIGTGIPTEPNLHQVVQDVAPESRVVYVDNDPIVLAHARALMHGTREGRTGYVDADVRRPQAILEAPELAKTLDMSKPIALSLIALLHFVTDDSEPYAIVKTLTDALAPGSFLVMSHVTADFDPRAVAKAVEIYNNSGVPAQARSKAEFARFFDGLELVEPGIVVPHRWHNNGVTPPASMDAHASLYAAVAGKPG